MEENNFELDQMRAEYQALKDTLAKQEIINDKLLKETMKGKVRSMRSHVAISIACGIFVMLMAPIVFHFNPVVNASWWFVIGTEILMVLCIFFDWKFNHKVRVSDIVSNNMLTFSKEVKAMKNNYRNWIYWGIPMGIIWCGWLIIEVLNSSQDTKLVMPLIVGLVIGMLAGMIIGYRLNRKIINTCDEIIEQIEK